MIRLATVGVAVLAALAGVVLIGCKGNDGATGSTARAPGSAAPAPADGGAPCALAPAPLPAMEPNSASAGDVSVDAAGRVTVRGAQVGVVSQAGELTSNGALVATINDQGRVDVMGWGPGLQLSVRADGSVLDHGKLVLEARAGGAVVLLSDRISRPNSRDVSP